MGIRISTTKKNGENYFFMYMNPTITIWTISQTYKLYLNEAQ